MQLPNFIKNSPTSIALIELHPKGSLVERVDIENKYIVLSKTQSRAKRIAKNCGKSYSVRMTRKLRGAKLYKYLVKKGFWLAKN